MNRITRFFSAFLAFSLILAAPGLAPFQAAAQTLGAARAVVPVGAIGATGASINGLGAANFVLPAASVSPLETRTGLDRKSTRLNSSHIQKSRMPSSA